jgi:hypothetical protein
MRRVSIRRMSCQGGDGWSVFLLPRIHSVYSRFAMRRLLLPLMLLAAVLAPRDAGAQSLPNPILFVTHVPTPFDSATACSMFANHVADMAGAPRGGDLWIRYPDGTLKNLTRAAGFGVDGVQAAGAIAVREPSVHWSGAKALFSMVVGGATSATDRTPFRWQIYEITGLGRDETPVITRIASQPAEYNNVSPIYGTDERIIFTSDRPTTGQAHLYPSFDEYKGAPTNTGLWSLDAASGDLHLLDNSPSGDFSPTIDSYGRLLVMRWDRLQRDRNADMDVLGTATKGTFNYTDESPNGTPQYGVRSESFPEPQGQRTDLLAGTNMTGHEFNQFFTWQLNEDGTSMVTLNHLGRHELRAQFNRAITDDPNVVPFNYAATPRSNRTPINSFMQVREHATTPGTYYGVNGLQIGTHGGGQIVTLTAAPTLDPEQTVVTSITDPATAMPLQGGQTPSAAHTGMYRNPTPLSDGTLIVSHSTSPYADANTGTAAAPASRHDYRLKTVKSSGSTLVADQPLTSGISKSVSYWVGGRLVTYNGALWEVDPVEVRPRAKPVRRVATIPSPELSIFTAEGVDPTSFSRWMSERDMAVIVMRDVRHRDRSDHQQPFRLQIPGSPGPLPPGNGKVYDITHLQIFQGDYVRGHGLTNATGTPAEGRRILAVPMHLPAGTNQADPAAPAGGVTIGRDGSVAAFVPAHRAMTWQLTGQSGAPIVRERYWVTFQSGEVRVCASCHGTNDDAASPLNPIPQNPPQALRDLLRSWKAQIIPAHITLVAPENNTTAAQTATSLLWRADDRSTRYRVQLSTSSSFATTILDRDSVAEITLPVSSLRHGATYYWRVRGASDYATGEWSDPFRFTTVDAPALATPLLSRPGDATQNVALTVPLFWRSVAGATTYHLQVAGDATFITPIVDRAAHADTTFPLGGLASATTYYWRVSAASGALESGWSDAWRFTTAAPPAGIGAATTGLSALRLERNRPDPFSSTTTVELQLPVRSLATVSLYDMRGLRVATLLRESLEQGIHLLTIDAGSGELSALRDGAYLLRVDTELGSRQIIMHLVR